MTRSAVLCNGDADVPTTLCSSVAVAFRTTRKMFAQEQYLDRVDLRISGNGNTPLARPESRAPPQIARGHQPPWRCQKSAGETMG